MQTYFWIFIGGGSGSILRFLISGWVGNKFGETFPFGTLVANISGCFLIGILAALSEPDGRLLLPPTARQFLMLGFLGGYTTFSSFSLQTLNLARDGEWLYSGLNILGSMMTCLIAVWLGFMIGQVWNR